MTIAELLNEVVSDDDLTSGREELHPGWLPIYADIKEGIKGTPCGAELASRFEQIQSDGQYLNEIDPLTSKVAFLLGAGASKPSPSDIPTVTELLSDLLMRGRRLDREDVNRLADFCDSSKITNIEDLLTAAQLAEYCGRNPTVLRLIDFLLYGERAELNQGGRKNNRMRVDIGSVAFLQDTLQVLFGLLSSRMLPAKPNAIHKAIAAFTKSRADTTIITTNYDCCIDLALGVDGKDFDYRMDFANSKIKSNKDLSNLIKLHGSLNWFSCDTCQNVNLTNISKAIKDYENDSSPYPVIGICKGCGGQRRVLLVPPLAMKFDLAPTLNPLLDLVNERLSEANLLVVVGFSFADADHHISRTVSKWMQSSDTNRLVIFDPDQVVAEKLRNLCSVKIKDFENNRIGWVGGGSPDKVSEFLSGKMYGNSVRAVEVAKKRKAVKRKAVKRKAVKRKSQA